jgi:hypothetical protein
MARASQADMEMAIKLCGALEAVDRRFFPEGCEGDNDPEDLDINNDAHCGTVLRHLHRVLQGGSIGRVIWGMAILMDRKSKLVDPNASTLERHPDLVLLPGGLEPIRQLLSDAGAALADLGACNDPECPEPACMRVRTRLEAQLRSLGS